MTSCHLNTLQFTTPYHTVVLPAHAQLCFVSAVDLELRRREAHLIQLTCEPVSLRVPNTTPPLRILPDPEVAQVRPGALHSELWDGSGMLCEMNESCQKQKCCRNSHYL